MGSLFLCRYFKANLSLHVAHPTSSGSVHFGNVNSCITMKPSLNPNSWQLRPWASPVPGPVGTNLPRATWSIFFPLFQINSLIRKNTHSCNKCAPPESQQRPELKTAKLTQVPALESWRGGGREHRRHKQINAEMEGEVRPQKNEGGWGR